MKKAIKFVSLLTAVVALICVMPASAHALTDARYAYAPAPSMLEIDDVDGMYKTLLKKAYDIDRDMIVIERSEMPDEAEIKYVQSNIGVSIKVYIDPEGDEKFDIIKDGTKVYVFYRVGNFAFIMTEGGLVGWCKTEYLANSYDAKLSAERRRAIDAKNGLYG